MAKIESFRFWCQKVLPLTYDDSLSYYELLCKVVTFLNNTIQAVNENTQLVDEMKEYMDNYFDNLDLQEEVNKKLDEMTEDGTLTNLIKPLVDSNFTTIFSQLNNINTDISVMNARMDSFTHLEEGSTTGDAELIDGRVGYDGYTYDNIGDAIRDQIDGVYINIDTYADHSINLYNPDDPRATQGCYISGSTGELVYSETYAEYICSNYIYIGDYSKIAFMFCKPSFVGFYDINKDFIVRMAGSSLPFETNINTTIDGTQAYYIRVDYHFTLANYPIAYVCGDVEDLTTVTYSHFGYTIKDSALSKNIVRLDDLIDYDFIPRKIEQCAWRGCVYAHFEDTPYLQKYAPENTLMAYKKAIEEGFDYLWIAGVRFSSENTPYCIHDASTGNVSQTDIVINDSTDAQIDAVVLNDGSYVAWPEADLHIPKLLDTIKLCVRGGINIGFRLAALPGNLNNETAVTRWNIFINMCRRFGLNNAIYSGSLNQCKVLKSFEPNWFIQVTGESSDTPEQTLTKLENIVAEGLRRCSYIAYPGALSEDVMSYAHNHDIAIFTPTHEPLITEEELTALCETYCVDGIITHAKLDTLNAELA